MEQETAYFFSSDSNCLSDKSFFFELSEYLQTVDYHMFNSVCTYHNMVKNALLKVVSPPKNAEALIKSEVCYFKNVLVTSDGQPIRQIKLRKRLRLETGIKRKIQLLKRDWADHIRAQYPELFTGNKPLCHFAETLEELLDQSVKVGTEDLRMPKFIFTQAPEAFKGVAAHFYDEIYKVYEDFSDYTKTDFNDKWVCFAKLATKSILFVAKMPSKKEFLALILSARSHEAGLKVEYFSVSRGFAGMSSLPGQLNNYFGVYEPEQQKEFPYKQEEEVSQIDEMSDFLFYIESCEQYAGSQLHFESHVSTILANFGAFLRANYDKIFAETVLMNINGITQPEQLEEDFARIQETMTRCRFRLDISFLCLLARSSPEEALDEVFAEIMGRNFREFSCGLRIFQENETYDERVLTMEQSSRLSQQYLRNLEGTQDSYSDGEDNRKKRIGFGAESAAEVYASCKKLLFKADLVVKDTSGTVVHQKKLEKFSEVFSPENRELVHQVNLESKAKYLARERHQAVRQQEELANIDKIDDEYLFQPMETTDDYSNSESSIEVQFSFYTVPRYVGIIRDAEVDFLSYEQDEILVNDDDHEDLIRVAELRSESHRLELEDLSGSPTLVKPFNKKQLVKGIPYYFKNTDNAKKKDYRVYYFDEIQRKIIFGILRRTYALIAQEFLQYLSLLTKNIDALNIITQQKYLGALLASQRRHLLVPLLENIPSNRFKTAERLLAEELKYAQVLNLGTVSWSTANSKSEEALYFLRQSSRQTNLSKIESTDSGASGSPGSQTQVPKTLEELDKLELDAKLSQEEGFTIPFWCTFKVTKASDSKGNHSLLIDVVYHLPIYQRQATLSEASIDSDLFRAFDTIARRVKMMLLLLQVDQKREIPKELTLSSEQHPILETSSFASYRSQMTSNRMELSKSKMNEIESSSPHIVKQPSAQQAALAKPTSSRFKARMEKYNKTLSGKDDNASSVPSSDILELNRTQETFALDKVFQYTFHLMHSAIKVEDGVNAIMDKTFGNFLLDGKDNVFVTRRENKIYLIRISGTSSQDPMSSKQSVLKSSTMSHIETLQTPSQTMEDETKPAKATAKQSQIQMEVFGTEAPSRTHIQPLIHTIELNLMRVTIDKLAENLMKHPGKMTKEDQAFIEGQDQRLLVAFPLNNCQLTDKFALINYLKQSLSRFLTPVYLDQRQKRGNGLEKQTSSVIDSMHQKFPEATDDSDSSIKRLPVSKEDIGEQQGQIPFIEEDFTLLYNYLFKVGSKLKEKTGQNFQMQNIFGHGLALAKIQVVNNFMEGPEQLSTIQMFQADKGLKTTPDHVCTTSTSVPRLQSYMPLVFKTEKQSGEYKLINEDLQIPLPQNKDPKLKWLILKVAQTGQLQTELFVKNFVLNLNQAINECMIELFIHGQLREMHAVKAVENLEKLVSHSRLSITSLASELEKMIYGDSSDIINTFIQPLASLFHQEFRNRTCQTGSDYFGSEWNIQLLVELVNKSTGALVKTMLFSLGEDLTSFDTFYQALKTHLPKSKTILRNIHPQFKLILGSFKMQPQSIDIYQEFGSPCFRFDGLRPEPTSTKRRDRFADIKVYPSTSSETLGTVSPRSFFLVLSIKDQSMTFRTYNVERKLRKTLKTAILSHLIWNSNRNHFFKRIVSQKLGTVYSLKDFYNSDKMIKTEGTNMFQKNKITYEKVAQVIEGKQVYNYIKKAKKPRQPREEQKISRIRKAADGLEYLKAIKENEGYLKALYKKAQMVDYSSTNQEAIEVRVPERKEEEPQKKKKQSIGFEEFLSHKRCTRPLQLGDKTMEIHLTHMYLIAPSLQPSRAYIVQAQQAKWESAPEQHVLNNDLLIKNPLYFHGMKMIKILQFFFERFKACQSVAQLFKEGEDNQLLKASQPADPFRRLIDDMQRGIRIKNLDSKVLIAQLLVSKSRLLYSNTIQQLFSSQADQIKFKQISETLKKDFLTVFINHLLGKAGVSKPLCHMYTLKKGRVKHRSIGGSQYLFKKTPDEEEELISVPIKTNSRLRRTKQFSEDKFEPDAKADTGSNSSLVISSSAVAPEIKRRHERVLHYINEEHQDGTLVSYILKTLADDSLMIYEVACQDGLIRVSVFKFESILKGFPKALVIKCNTLTTSQQIRDRKRIVVTEEQSLSQRLNPDSINYDFHIKEIRNLLVMQSKYFDLGQQIQNVLGFYKTPPKYARNFLTQVVLRIDLGNMDGVTGEEFMSFFCQQDYDYKILPGHLSLFKEEGFKAKIEIQTSKQRQTSILSSMPIVEEVDEQAITITNNKQQSFVSSKDFLAPERLYFAELRSAGSEADKIFEVECKRQESSTKDVGAGESTKVDISFYFICTLANQNADFSKNSDRYPMPDVCILMGNFISNLTEKMGLCRTKLITQQLRKKFFEHKVAMSEVEVQDMLKFSFKIDIKDIDTRYKELLAQDLYRKTLSDFLKHIFKGRVFTFNSHQQQFIGPAAQLAREQVLLPDLLIYEKDGTLVHMEFKYTEKRVQMQIIRKEGPFSELTATEDRLVKQVMNHITFYLWKRSSSNAF